jgi:hypothetical protein
MRALPLAVIVIATVGVLAGCYGGSGNIKEDDVASCMRDSGKFTAVVSGSQLRYTGSEGGVQGSYKAAQPVTVYVLLGMDSGEASNLSSNMQESGEFVDVNRKRNAVYAIPVADQNAPSRSAAGDTVNSCL